MPDIRAHVMVSQESEGRLVEAVLTRALVERLLAKGRVELRVGDDNAEFDDQTARAGDDPYNPAVVSRLYVTVVDDFELGED